MRWYVNFLKAERELEKPGGEEQYSRGGCTVSKREPAGGRCEGSELQSWVRQWESELGHGARRGVEHQ